VIGYVTSMPLLFEARMLSAWLVAAAVTFTPANPAAAQPICGAGLEPWTEIELFLGRAMPDGSEVSEVEFHAFLAETVTPLFPEGLTVTDAWGQYRDGDAVVRERTKLLLILLPEATASVRDAIAGLIDAYKMQFRQTSVLRVERAVCVAFQ
jgi:hypothetical protein